MKDLKGQKFTRLLVVGGPTIRNGSTYFTCKCDCGTVKEVRSSHLIQEKTLSCGCFNKEKNSLVHKPHGMTKTATYHSWQGMYRRCYNKYDPKYSIYGARGIKVCERWLELFENFYEDMGECPNGCSIDRIDNNGDYSKENCRWATSKEQANNRRCSKIHIYNGKKQNQKDWSKEFNISPSMLERRLTHDKTFEWCYEYYKLGLHKTLGSKK